MSQQNNEELRINKKYLRMITGALFFICGILLVDLAVTLSSNADDELQKTFQSKD